MEQFEIEVYKRLLTKVEALIQELELLNEENKVFLEAATINKNIPTEAMQSRMSWAAEIIKRLKVAKADKESIMEKLK